jgi:hypothetical protein
MEAGTACLINNLPIGCVPKSLEDVFAIMQ